MGAECPVLRLVWEQEERPACTLIPGTRTTESSRRFSSQTMPMDFYQSTRGTACILPHRHH
jgi:hypothetical protein